MEVLDLQTLLSDKVFKEQAFREAVKQFDWARFQGKPVLIQGCGHILVPTWAYLVVMAQVYPYARSIWYGEVKSPIPIVRKDDEERNRWPSSLNKTF